jgi:ABC-type transporter Mla subunit MlaD
MTNERLLTVSERLFEQQEEVMARLLRVCEVLESVQNRMEQLEGAMVRTIDLMDRASENSEHIVTAIRDLTDVVKQTNGAVGDSTDGLVKLLAIIRSYFSDGSSVKYEN